MLFRLLTEQVAALAAQVASLRHRNLTLHNRNAYTRQRLADQKERYRKLNAVVLKVAAKLRKNPNAAQPPAARTPAPTPKADTCWRTPPSRRHTVHAGATPPPATARAERPPSSAGGATRKLDFF